MYLRAIRESLGLSQKDVAIKMGVPPSNICNYETGRTEPSLETLCKLADILNCSVDYLLGRENDFGNITIIPTLDSALNSAEVELIKDFRALNMYQREVFSQLVKIITRK